MTVFTFSKVGSHAFTKCKFFRHNHSPFRAQSCNNCIAMSACPWPIATWWNFSIPITSAAISCNSCSTEKCIRLKDCHIFEIICPIWEESWLVFCYSEKQRWHVYNIDVYLSAVQWVLRPENMKTSLDAGSMYNCYISGADCSIDGQLKPELA